MDIFFLTYLRNFKFAFSHYYTNTQLMNVFLTQFMTVNIQEEIQFWWDVFLGHSVDSSALSMAVFSKILKVSNIFDD